MADFSVQSQDYNRITIATATSDAIGTELIGIRVTATGTAATWPAANRAIYVPFLVFVPFVATVMSIENAGTVSGNFDIGIYDDQGSRLVSSGSTVHSGTSAIQSVDITDTTLNPGRYFLALSFDNNTAVLRTFTAGAVALASASGVLSQSTAFPLPSPATFAAAQDTLIPYLSVTGRTTI